MVPPQTRPSCAARSSLSSYSRYCASPPRFISCEAAYQMSPSTQPPPSVPTPDPSPRTSNFAPGFCGVEPLVRMTVAITNRSSLWSRFTASWKTSCISHFRQLWMDWFCSGFGTTRVSHWDLRRTHKGCADGSPTILHVLVYC